MSEVDGAPKPPRLPSGIESTEKGPLLVVTRADFPWLSVGQETTYLAKIRVAGGGTCYIGSLHRGKLQKIASEIDREHSDIADKIFYSRLPSIIDNKENPTIRKVENPVTRKAIYYIKDGEMRVYFMLLDELLPINGRKVGNQREHVIIRIATCHKTRNSQENKVLSVISKDSLPEIKRRTGV